MSAGMVGVPLSVCLLFGTLLQAGARGSPGERLDGGCPVGAPRVTEQILRSHLVEVPPPDYVGSGSAAVEIQVDEGGNVCYASLVFADAGLGESAVAWAKRLRFSPFLLAGFPTQVTATLPLRFGEKQAVSHGLQRQKDDLCGNGNLCLYLKPDGTLLKDGEMVSGAALGFALDHIDGHVIVRPDPRTPLTVVKRTHASLTRMAPRAVRFSAPYYNTERNELVRVPGQFVDRNAVIQAARQMGYQVMQFELRVEFPETGVEQSIGSFTVNLTGKATAARRMRSLKYQGPPRSLPGPWPEQWLYEFEVDADGAVLFRTPEDDEPETELDDAVLSHSRAVVSPPPYPAPARVLLRLQLAR